jgi:hypothetical protein
MLMETFTIRFPNAETAPIEIASSHIAGLRQKFLDSGKLIKESTISHGLTRVGVRLFRDAEAHREWWTDPIVEARRRIYAEYYERHQISYEHKLETL